MIREPHPLIGPSRQSAWQNTARRNAQASRVGFPAGVTMARTSKGTVFQAQSSGTIGASELAVDSFEVQTELDNYLSCRRYVGGAGVGELINVAKPFDLARTSWDAKTFSLPERAGFAARQVRYNYQGIGVRIATSEGYTETQLILPQYITGSVILAVLFQVTYAAETFSYMEFPSQRGWAKAEFAT